MYLRYSLYKIIKIKKNLNLNRLPFTIYNNNGYRSKFMILVQFLKYQNFEYFKTYYNYESYCIQFGKMVKTT